MDAVKKYALTSLMRASLNNIITWVNSDTDKLNFKWKFSMQIANYVTPTIFIIVQKSPKSLAAGALPQTPWGS